MQCWCKTNGDEKAKSIEEAQSHIKVQTSVKDSKHHYINIAKPRAGVLLLMDKVLSFSKT